MRRLGAILILLATAAIAGEPHRATRPGGETDDPAGGERPAGWALHRGDRQLTGVAPGTLSADLHLKWTFPISRPANSSPVVADGRVYVGTDDGKVLAIDPGSGDEVWSRDVGAGVGAPPTVHDGRLYVGDEDGTLHCLAAADGEPLWTYPTDGEIAGAANWAYVTDDEGEAHLRILVGSWDFHLHCVDADGKRVWAYETENYVNGTPAVVNGVAVFGGCDRNVYAVAVADGSERERVDTGSYIAASVAADGSEAYVGHFGGRVVRVDLEAGEIVWEYGEGDKPFFSAPALAGDRIVIGSRDDHVHCFARDNGERLWTFRTGGMVDASPVICDGKVVAGSDDGKVYLLDLADGTELWSHRLRDRITTSPAVANGQVLVACDDGKLYCFGPRGPGEDEDAETRPAPEDTSEP